MANKENELARAGHLPEKLRRDPRTDLINSGDLVLHRRKAHHQNTVGFFLRFLRTMKQWHSFVQQEFEIECSFNILEKEKYT